MDSKSNQSLSYRLCVLTLWSSSKFRTSENLNEPVESDSVCHVCHHYQESGQFNLVFKYFLIHIRFAICSHCDGKTFEKWRHKGRLELGIRAQYAQYATNGRTGINRRLLIGCVAACRDCHLLYYRFTIIKSDLSRKPSKLFVIHDFCGERLWLKMNACELPWMNIAKKKKKRLNGET